jgi:hypothetical protein
MGNSKFGVASGKGASVKVPADILDPAIIGNSNLAVTSAVVTVPTKDICKSNGLFHSQ